MGVDNSGPRVAVYFLHLPYPREDNHAELSEGVADVIARLIQLELDARKIE